MRATLGSTTLWIFACVCILYALCFFVIAFAAHSHGYALSYVTSGDSAAYDEWQYVELAKTMLAEHRFALSPDAPANVFRTPGYPVFLVPFLALFGTPVAAVLFQIVVTACSAVLIFLLGEKIFSRGVGVGAAALFALDPTVIVHTFITYSDTVFVSLVLAVTALFMLPEKLSWKTASLAGALAGFAVLVRPIGLYALPVLLIFVLWARRREWRQALTAAACFAVAAALFVVPWMVRNEMVAGNFSISSVGTYNLLFYNAVEFDHETTGESKSAVVARFEQTLGTSDETALKSFAYSKEERALIRETLIAHLPAYTLFHLYKTIPFYLSSSIQATERILYEKGVLSGTEPDAPNITGLILKKDFSGAFAALVENVPAFAERFYWLAIAVSSFCFALYAAYTKRASWRFAVAAVCVAACFALLTGPVSFPRYRLPAEPFLLLAACAAGSALLPLVKNGAARMMGQGRL